MPFAAGEIVTAARLNRLQPVTFEAPATADLTLTTIDTDITGAEFTAITQTNNAIYVVAGDFDMHATTGASGVLMAGKLMVDGVVDTEIATADATTSGTRNTVGQHWRGTLATAGSHTFQLQGSKNISAGVAVAHAIHTKITVWIYEVV